MDYRLTREDLLETLGLWNGFLNKKVHLIACGGTALTLLGIKASTKDVDLLVPVDDEYRYLIKTLEQLGYRQQTGSGWTRKDEEFIFDLFQGKRIHTTELLESPMEEKNHTLIKELSHIYIGVLNEYDLMISKLFRGTSVDIEDCLMLLRARPQEIKIDVLGNRYMETAKYDVAEDRLIKNWEHFEQVFKKEKSHGK
ncbi:MAG: hypothetical protein HY209_06540 [Candidatus Omnitrophica bacterium]|nr:hypothetical protein [Candidatus Omnitrophota bacterium]